MPDHPTQYLAERIVATGLAAAPPEAIRIAKDTFLDTVACMLAGAPEQGGRMVADYARRAGGGPASIVGTGDRVATFMAALANGTSAAILDYDDSIWKALSHVSGTVVPAVLALGEERHCSGRAVLEAYMVGFETVAKLGRGLVPGIYLSGHHPTGALGIFGAAAASAKLLDLDAARTTMALGIAASCSSSLRGSFGSMVKGLHSGEAAANGVLSACLAAEGFTGRPDILECRFGFAERSVHGGQYQLDEIGRDFGNPWQFVDPGVGIKLFPSGTASFCAGECATEIATRYDVDPRAIANVEFRTTRVALNISWYPMPADANEAYYSIPWAVAVGLIDRRIGLAQMSPERIGNPRVRELCAKVVLSEHPDLKVGQDLKDAVGGELIVRLNDGRELRHLRRWPRAYPGGEPWTREQLLEKYREAAARSVTSERAEASISLLSKIESLPDICELTETLRSSP